MKKIILLLLSALPVPAIAQTADNDVAWSIVEGLTTEVGQRLAATEAEARARDWAVIKLKALGFSNVRIEPFMMPAWVRGAETASLITPYPHNLAITALGNSGATPATGMTGEIVAFRDFDAFKAAPESMVRGKIVYVGHFMKAAQDGASYGYSGMVRRQGPNLAAKKGALAMVIRSIGTDGHRNPHTGNTSWETGVTPIPAAAVSNPDADLIERIVARGGAPLRLNLLLTPKFIGQQASGNVIAEVPGTDPEAGLVVIGGHLDSWDLGQGAIDDGAGVAITTAAAKAILDSGKKPRRTIRVVWFGAEEVGIFGGNAYFAAHKAEKYALAAESDFGADRIWRVDFRLPESAKPLAARITSALAPLGITPSRELASDGADIGPLLGAGVNSIALQQDGTRYFDIHHTPDDTLDKIDRAQLAQNVAAWTLMVDLVANAPEDLPQAQVMLAK